MANDLAAKSSPPSPGGGAAVNSLNPTHPILETPPPNSRKRLVPLARSCSISKASSHVQKDSRHPATFWLKVPGQPDRPVVLVQGPSDLKGSARIPTDQPTPNKVACPPDLTPTKVSDSCLKSELASKPPRSSLSTRFTSHLPFVPRRIPLAEDQTRARDSARLQRRLRRSGFKIPPPAVEKVKRDPKVTDEMLTRGAIDRFPLGPSLWHAFIHEHWFDFRSAHEISAQVRPMWEDYQAYFRSCRDRPLDFSHLKRLYWGLRRIHAHLYWERFPDWSIVDDEIKRHDWSKKPRCLTCLNTPNSHRFKAKCTQCANKNRDPKDVKRKAKLKRLLRGITRRQTSSFSLKDLERFLNEADSGERSLLICQVVIVVLLCGWCRLEELRHISRCDVRLVPKGYQITFQPNPILKVTHKFLIPRNKVGRNNICFADFLFKYFEDLDRNVFTANHTCLFITGKELMMDNMPKIIGVPMGSTALFGVGRTVASWLKLPNPDNFTSHVSFREAREEFAQIYGWQTRISIKDESIAGTGESLGIESVFLTSDQKLMSKQIDDNTNCEETDPLNQHSIKVDPSEFESSDSISASYAVEGDQNIIKIYPEGSSVPSTGGIFITEGLYYDPSKDEEQPTELSNSLDFLKSEDPEELLTTEIKIEDRLPGDVMANS